MLFIDADHENFFNANKKGNVRFDSMVYTFGICEDTRNHFGSLYDAKEKRICLEQIHAAWQTTGSLPVTRLAFNLFTGTTPTAMKNMDLSECREYSVSEIFGCGFAPYFVQAIAILYPEYMH